MKYYFNSNLNLNANSKFINRFLGSLRDRIAQWSRNNAMCALTEQVIFTGKYGRSVRMA
jgi:hypothetical protein